MQQVYLKTSETLRAEKEIIKHIQVNPWPLEKKIPQRLFNALLSGIRDFEAEQYIENGIPYKKQIDGAVIEYTLRSK